jgi:hypothetical protein
MPAGWWKLTYSLKAYDRTKVTGFEQLEANGPTEIIEPIGRRYVLKQLLAPPTDL